MAKSKIAKLCDLLDAAGASDPLMTPLGRYHAASEAMNACRRRDLNEARRGVAQALKRFNVRVELVNGYVAVTTFNRPHIWA